MQLVGKEGIGSLSIKDPKHPQPLQAVTVKRSSRRLQGTAQWRELAVIYIAVASDALSMYVMTAFTFLWLKEGLKYSDAEFKTGQYLCP